MNRLLVTHSAPLEQKCEQSSDVAGFCSLVQAEALLSKVESCLFLGWKSGICSSFPAVIMPYLPCSGLAVLVPKCHHLLCLNVKGYPHLTAR